MDYIEALEEGLGITAEKELLPLQPGDVPDTYADVSDLVEQFDYKPATSVQDGIQAFTDWYKAYHKITWPIIAAIWAFTGEKDTLNRYGFVRKRLRNLLLSQSTQSSLRKEWKLFW